MTIRFKNDIINRRRSDFRGGKCLSKKYINTKSKLKFECSEVHVWEATPNAVQGGTWCPKCSQKERLTIELM